MIHFQPVTPHTPPLQLDLIRISGWWPHRTRPFIQTVGYHYCKLLSPARAMEWVYVDGLKARIEKQVVWLGCLELRPDRVSKLVQLLHLYCCHLWLTCSWSLFRSSMVQRMSPRLLFERRTQWFLARDHGMVEWERWKKSIHLAIFQCQSTKIKLWGAKLYFSFKGFNTAQYRFCMFLPLAFCFQSPHLLCFVFWHLLTKLTCDRRSTVLYSNLALGYHDRHICMFFQFRCVASRKEITQNTS